MADIIVSAANLEEFTVQSVAPIEFLVSGALAGPAGAPGTVGATGPAGAQGLAGATGVQGTAGPTGSQGIQGSTGPEGAQGPIGATGAAGASGSSGLTKALTQTAHAFAVGDAVRYSPTLSTYVKAQANDIFTTSVDGIVSIVTDANNFTITTGGYISGLSGLTAGRNYLSAATAGGLTTIPPVGNNTVIKPLLHAVSATAGYVQIGRGAVNIVSNTSPRVGVNFGLQSTFDAAYYAKWLSWVGRYTRLLRFSIPSWDATSGIANIKLGVVMARDLGFKTSYGVTAAGTGHNLTYVNGWQAAVDTAAAWADANGVDTFYIGNEEDWWINQGGITGITESALQNWVLAKATSLKTLYPKMKIVYSTAEGEITNWQTKGTGSLDGLGFNAYGDKAHFVGLLPYLKSLFGGVLFLSEWGPQYPYAQCKLAVGSGGLGYTDAQYKQNWADIEQAIRDASITAYMFDFDWGGAYGTVTDWGLYNGDGTFKPGFDQIFRIPR